MSEQKLSKYLAYLLRHHPEVANLNMDKNGWVEVDELIANTEGNFTRENLEKIVRTDKKRRYSFNEDESKVRANQGHSINVDVELDEVIPVFKLYHGTADKFLDSIMKEGIKPQTRQYVHLSRDYDTAVKVGARHGNVVVLEIDTKAMVEDGIKFYLSANGVWLTKYIDPKYIIQQPYIKVGKYSRMRYNPYYGDNRKCECGHAYVRHFDSYHNMYPCGCKYCSCREFKEEEV